MSKHTQELIAAATAVTGMLEIFLDELYIKEKTYGYNRGAVDGMAKLQALRSAIAKAQMENRHELA